MTEQAALQERRMRLALALIFDYLPTKADSERVSALAVRNGWLNKTPTGLVPTVLATEPRDVIERDPGLLSRAESASDLVHDLPFDIVQIYEAVWHACYGNRDNVTFEHLKGHPACRNLSQRDIASCACDLHEFGFLTYAEADRLHFLEWYQTKVLPHLPETIAEYADC